VGCEKLIFYKGKLRLPSTQRNEELRNDDMYHYQETCKKIMVADSGRFKKMFRR